MASEDHLNLASFIKSVHEQLRQNTRIYGEENAWYQHCENNEILQKYSSAMQNLSINYWENNYKQNKKAISRISWIYNYTIQYFFGGLLIEHREKELGIVKKINLDICDLILDNSINKDRILKVLDVGSCYNPFKKYKNFDVIPIDIAPATDDVYKCDFLNLKLSYEQHDTTMAKEIKELTTNCFDTIIFSLLLEYLPTANQRLNCCKKAYDLLKFEGILIIITPDSKHVNANSKIIKSWRYILAKMGFSRIKYDKLPHLHCMVFRKCLKREISERWATLKDPQQFIHEMIIPQDINRINTTVNNDNCSSKFDDCDVKLFEELPFT